MLFRMQESFLAPPMVSLDVDMLIDLPPYRDTKASRFALRAMGNAGSSTN
jgi:hypothetical protein